MAKNQQTFKTVVKMEAAQFKREARNIQKTVGQLKNTFLGFAASLGAGLGLSNLISSMRKTSVELSTAMATLENVSQQTKKYTIGNQEAMIATSNFGEEFEFVKKLAAEYKQDLIALTNGYAQFKAASQKSSLTMEDQKKVYEALTRAATYFHMTGDRTRDMMNAVIQMMSKGKVASEELRRQLGNNLPGAFNIMAVAAQKAGISVSGTLAEFEDLMKDGKVMSDKVLPAFADELNKITQNINLDSLQLVINDLKNAWTNLTKEVNMEDFYKKILQATTSAVNFIKNHLQGIKAAVIGTFAAIGNYKLFAPIMKQGQDWYDKQEALLKRYKTECEKIFDQLDKLDGERGFDLKKGRDGMFKGSFNQSAFNLPSKQDQDKILKTVGTLNAKTKQLNQQTALIGAGWGKARIALKGFSLTLKSIGATLASMGLIALLSAAIGLVTSLVTKFIEWRKELKEIKKGLKDFDDVSNESVDALTKQKVEMDHLLSTLKKVEGNEKKWAKVVKEINTLMGGVEGYSVDTKDSYETIASKAKDWYDELTKIARVQALLNEKAENENRAKQYETKILEKNKEIQEHQKSWGIGNTPAAYDKPFSGNAKRRAEVDALKEGLGVLVSRNKEIDEELKKLGVELATEQEIEDTQKTGGGEQEDRLKRLQKILDDYKQKVDELSSQYSRGAISSTEYDSAINKLNTDTWKAVAAFSDLEVLLKSVAGGMELVANIAQGASFASVWEEVNKIVEQSIKDVDEFIAAEEKALEKKNEARGSFAAYTRPGEPAARKTTFDYKKSSSEIYREEVDRLEDYKDKIQEAITQVKGFVREGVEGAQTELDALLSILDELIKKTKDLGDKADMAEIYADYKEAAQDAFEGSIEGINNVVSVFERLTNAVIRYKEAHGESMTKAEQEEWDRLTSSIGLFMEILESITSLYKTLNTLEQVWVAIEKMKGKEQKKNITTNIAEIATEKAKTSAKAAGAVAGATEAGSSIPFPYNLLAIAAGIAAVIGALAMMSKFENGGFVKGKGNHGDHNAVRVNNGELILNPAQQRNLLALANGTSGIGGGEVQFKIRGADLVGVLNNESNRRKG